MQTVLLIHSIVTTPVWVLAELSIVIDAAATLVCRMTQTGPFHRRIAMALAVRQTVLAGNRLAMSAAAAAAFRII